MTARALRAPAALALAALALLGSACAAGPGVAPAFLRPAPRVELPQRLHVRTGGRIVSVDLESYVVDTILSEVSPVNESAETVAAILEVQSVVARTYAASRAGRHRTEGFDLCDSTHCQVYQPARRLSSRFAAAAREAVQRTRALVLTYDARPIEALFHADCGGATAAADAVWGGAPVPYLQPAVDDLPEPTHRPWRVAATAEQLRKALNLDTRTAVGARLLSITVLSRDSSGRAASLSLRGEQSLTVRGDLVRTVLNRTLGDRAVQSTRFTIERQGSDVVLSGTGFGHGVGLCQRGAASRLRRGDTVENTLRAYYAGAQLRRGTQP